MIHSATIIAHRLAQGFLLFAAAFTMLLLLSETFLLPRWGQVRIGGASVPIVELPQREERLRERLRAEESRREEFLFPQRDALHAHITNDRLHWFSIVTLQSSVREVARKTAPAGAIAVSRLVLHERNKTLTLEGDVRSVGLKSMTVLAQFTEGLKALPVAARVTPPVFTRAYDAVVGFHSPFRIHIDLRSDV